MATKTRKTGRMDEGVLAMLAESWDRTRGGTMNGYTEKAARAKNMAHSETAKVLRYFATEVMGLKPGQFEVRSNKGGVAVSGEVMLYVDKVGDRGVGLWVQVSETMGGPCGAVLFRTSEGKVGDRFDSGAGMKHRNNYATFVNAFGSVESMRRFYSTQVVPLMYVPHDDGTGFYYPQVGETAKDGRG